MLPGAGPAFLTEQIVGKVSRLVPPDLFLPLFIDHRVRTGVAAPFFLPPAPVARPVRHEPDGDHADAKFFSSTAETSLISLIFPASSWTSWMPSADITSSEATV